MNQKNDLQSLNNKLLVTDINMKPYQEIMVDEQGEPTHIQSTDQVLEFLGQEITRDEDTLSNKIPSYTAR